MGQEIELKLSIHDSDMAKLWAHSLVDRYASTKETRHQLFNTYYDTPDFQLLSHAMALRVRRIADRYIQTVKTRGAGVGGVSHRGEWEWPLDTDLLRPALVPEALWPPGLKGRLDALRAVFHTDFQRRTRTVKLPAGLFDGNQPVAEIELAFDSGRVTRLSEDKRFDTLSEVEMELIHGDSVTLYDFALAITAGVPMRPCDISKAERGYRLLDQPLMRHDAMPVSLNEDQSAEQVFSAAFSQVLGLWVRMEELFSHTGNDNCRTTTRYAIKGLQWLFDYFHCILPDGERGRWSSSLSIADAHIRNELKANLDGRIILVLARWLHCREWQHRQTKRRQEIAAEKFRIFAGARITAYRKWYADFLKKAAVAIE